MIYLLLFLFVGTLVFLYFLKKRDRLYLESSLKDVLSPSIQQEISQEEEIRKQRKKKFSASFQKALDRGKNKKRLIP